MDYQPSVKSIIFSDLIAKLNLGKMKVAVDEKFYSYKYVTVVVIESDSR